MDFAEISHIANSIRTANRSKSAFSISTSLLASILSALQALDEPTSTFQNNNPRMQYVRDLQFLRDFCANLTHLKVYSDSQKSSDCNLAIFTRLHTLEVNNVHISTIQGLKQIQSTLRKIVCHQASNSLKDMLGSNLWKELKEASFSRSNLATLDPSLEYIPYIHTLDLSHNILDNADLLSMLPNLKHLNLSYNKLSRVPQWNGQICSRLQHLILNNNFIEDLSGLAQLTNIFILDLSNNCVVSHDSLIVLAQLATLQWLSLEGNPLTYHPVHRVKTLNHLHSNTASVNFVLDGVSLTKTERKHVGMFRFRPKVAESASESSALGSRVRKVRHVVISEEGSDTGSPVLSSTPQEHLETKKQIEDLREQFGESWLNAQSGALVQSVLGMEASQQLSTSPYPEDFFFHAKNPRENDTPEPVETSEDTTEEIEAVVTPEPEDFTDDESIQGEESLYLVTVEDETEPIFVAITDKHIAEKECLTSKERARWHIDSIITCKITEVLNIVQIDYETMRKDRKQRRYIFEGDQEQFVALVNERMDLREPKQEASNKLQCIKCMTVFAKTNNGAVLEEKAVSCPNCDSNLVVEHIHS